MVVFILCDLLAGARDSRACRSDQALAVDVGIGEEERVATRDGRLFCCFCWAIEKYGKRSVDLLWDSLVLLIWQLLKVPTYAWEPCWTETWLMICSWGPRVSGQFSTPSSGYVVHTAVSDRVVTRSRALCVAVSKGRSFCGR